MQNTNPSCFLYFVAWRQTLKHLDRFKKMPLFLDVKAGSFAKGRNVQGQTDVSNHYESAQTASGRLSVPLAMQCSNFCSLVLGGMVSDPLACTNE